MNRLKRLLNEVRPYFPEVAQGEIRIETAKLEVLGFELATSYDKKKIGYIPLDPKTAILPTPSIRGGIAHKLVHWVRGRTLEKQQKASEATKKYHQPLWLAAEERATDGEVIRRGFGNDLYTLAHYILTQNKVCAPEFGLHPEEIQAILNAYP